MTNKFKKALSSIICVFTLSSGVTGIIANATYGDFSFKINRSSYKYSSEQTKDTIHSTSDFAAVYPTYGLAASCPIGVGVVNSGNKAVRANTLWFNSLDGKHLPYINTSSTPSPGGETKLCLKGTAGYYYTELDGQWEC